ncbi:MAG TPA: hypothetical protein VGM51_09745 [Armatimonadota bacterium]|jgi:hypothetical protein
MKVLLMGAVALTLAAGKAVAQPASDYTMQNKCVVANSLCFIVRAPAADLSATKRVDLMNDRLAYILGYERLTPDNIRVREQASGHAIYVGNSLLIDVTSNDAAADKTTTKALAHEWVSRLRAALPQARPTMYSGYAAPNSRREAKR